VAGASPFRFLCRMTLRGWLGFSYAAGMRRVACLSTFFLLLVSAASAQKVENLGAFSGEASEKIKAAIGATGYRVFLPNTLAACDLWLAKDVAAAKRADAKGAAYPEFADSEFLGVITFPKGGGHDFRGQTVRPGTYTMRYQLLPSDGNHLGVAPNPDFVLLTSVFEDTDPSANYDFGKLVEMSSGAAHSSHPAAFEMMPPETGEPHAAQTDDGWIVLQAPVTTKEGKKMMVGIVVKGSAAQ
jgi:hypothetical protein